ncbi:SepM family pheromone-processing serine protease [Vagococcus sp. JNUCC 83]
MNKEHFKNKSFYLKILGVLVVVLVLIFPLPYYIESPGSADKLNDIITVDGKKDTEKGSFMMTTVQVQKANVLTALLSKFDKNAELVPKQDILGDSKSGEYDRIQEYNMENSKNEAIQIALELADIPYKRIYKGIYVLSVADYSSFYKKLEVGDLITKLNNQTVLESDNFISELKKMSVDDTVKIGYKRDDKEENVEGHIIKLPKLNRPGIGVTVVDQTSIETDKKIEFDTQGVSGPSAGLMFSLELYSMLSHKDLKKGRNIAGTGTINDQGEVGDIGGIDKKVVAAEKAGATIFFAPNNESDGKTNYEVAKESAKKNKLNLTIVPVKTIQDAINYLEKHTT